MLRAALREHGVPDEAIRVIPEETEAVEAALRAAEPGDLVLIFGDAISRTWKQIIYFSPENEAATAGSPAAGPPEREAAGPLGEEFDMDPGRRLIRDHRGVRIARDQQED
jgi:cyanophycin synthetase